MTEKADDRKLLYYICFLPSVFSVIRHLSSEFTGVFVNKLISVFILIILLAACAPKKIATNVIGQIATDGIVSVESEEDVGFAKEAAPALIKTLEVLSHGNPKDSKIMTILSRSYAQYAFGFVEEEMLVNLSKPTELAEAKRRAVLFYDRGRTYGIAALLSYGSMKKAFKSPFPEFKKAVGGLGKKAAPAMFWTAFNWASYLNLNLEDPAAIADLPRIEALVDRVLEIDPDYYFGSAHALKGVIAISRPPMLGGNPAKAKEEFNKALDAAPDFQMTKVMYAQYYARLTQDKALFSKTLGEVVESDPLKLKSAALANQMAIKRAKLLLKDIDKLF